MNIQCSNEFMRNQQHAVIMSPDVHFDVLQTPEGNALFFSIGTDNVFYVTRELPANTTGGWSKIDLSSALSQNHQNAPVTVKKFQVSQNLGKGTVDLVLAVTVNKEDFLYVSIGNKNTAADWMPGVAWTVMAYDDAANPLPALFIEDIYTAMSGTTEYIVADILKDPASPLPLITRYFIDPSASLTGFKWNLHELSVSLQEATSYMGRKEGQQVDGIYTLGTIGGTKELVYTQLYDPYDISQAPQATRLVLPADTVACALSLNEEGFTDLFLAAGGSLYFMDSSLQLENQPPVKVYTHPLLNDVQRLHVNNKDKQVIVWGVNAAQELFYLKTLAGNETLTTSWSVPVPIVSNTIKAATYLHNLADCNVIFSHLSDDTLIQLTQDPLTTVWQQRSILLPATDPDDIIEKPTYTTLLRLADDYDTPLYNEPVAIASSGLCSVYINNLYYVLSPGVPVTVPTDLSGTISIVQEVDGINAACYIIAAGDQKLAVNTMSTLIDAFQGKSLDDTVTDEWENTRPLTGNAFTADQKKALTRGMDRFIAMAKTMPQDGSGRVSGIAAGEGSSFSFSMSFANNDIQYSETNSLHSLGDHVLEATAGDIWRWTRNAAKTVEGFTVKVAGNIHHIYFSIEGAVFHFVVNCIADALQGIQLLLHKIKVLIDDLVDWLGSILHWKAIVRTKDVMKNVFIRYFDHLTDDINSLENKAQIAFDNLKSDINNWAGLPTVSQSYRQFTSSVKPIPGQHSASANWGVNHFKSGIRKASFSYAPDNLVPDDDVMKVFNAIMDAVHAEGDVLNEAISNVQNILKQLDSSTSDILKMITAILSDALLGTAENIILLFLKILAVLMADAPKVLNATINIPVISWMYKKASGKNLSALDLSCLILAIPVNVLYRAVRHTEPFPKNDITQALIDAPDFAAIQQLCSNNVAVARQVPGSAMQTDTLYDKLAFAANGMAMVGAVIIPFTTYQKTIDKEDPKLWYFLNGLVYLPYTAPDIIGQLKMIADKKWYAGLNTLITGIAIGKAMIDVSTFRKNKFTQEWVELSPWMDFVISIAWEVPNVGAMCYPENDTVNGFLNYYGNTFFNASGLLSPLLANDDDPLSWGIASTANLFYNGAYAILSIAQSID